MTMQQLRLAIEAAEKGSISGAAEKLNISQPNASLSLKKLEEELGYSLFRRVGGGISPTEQGYHFLEHAQALLDEDRAIRAIGSAETISRLRVGVMNIACGIDAFLQFCSEKKGVPSGDLTCINLAPEIGLRLLGERKLDVLVSVVLKESIQLLEKECRENRYTLKKLTKIPMCVRVRREHPLVISGALDGSAKSFRLLGDYPYAEYVHLEHLMNDYNKTAPVPFGCSSKIFVDERETRLRVLSETDAYNVGAQLSDEKLEKYGLVTFPTGIEATLVCCMRKGDDALSDVARYLEILKAEAERIYT